MAVLEFKNITKHFNDITALQNVSFKTRDGEFLVILGPSGAGKTTTLKITCGLVNPTEGTVFLDDRDITKVPPYQRNISMTFETYSLYPHMTVFDNMAYPLRSKKGEFETSEIRQRVEQVARMLHIDELLNRYPAEASGGQKQRIALGRTMVRKPDVYLLDEPLAHLDAKIRVELREEFHRIEELQKTTTIYVTHDYIEALSLGDRIMILNEGELLQIGTPEEVFNNPVNLEVARQVGQPAINTFDCTIKKGEKGFYLQSNNEQSISFQILPQQQKLLEKYGKERVILGIRPKDIGITEIDKDNRIKAKVEVFQPLGSEGVLTTRAGELPFVGLIDPEAHVKHDELLEIFLDTNAFYFFDYDLKINLTTH